MCIPHAPTNTFKAEKREKKTKPKASVPFDKKLLEPDPDFKDERTHKFAPNDEHKSLLDGLLSIFK